MQGYCAHGIGADGHIEKIPERLKIPEHLAGQNHQGGDRDDGHLDDDGAERQKPDFPLRLCVHAGRPRLMEQGYQGTGEAQRQEVRSCRGYQVN
jgi:hypothetical protein